MAGSREFTCERCGRTFSVSPAALARFPGWTPRRCLKCRERMAPAAAARPGAATPAPRPAAGLAAPRTPPALAQGDGRTGDPHLDRKLQEVLERYSAGPREGLFTDGGCSGNPGPGGFGAVLVRDDKLVEQVFGREDRTTNNRMELRGLIAGLGLVAPEETITVWSDSELCVKTINEWAPRWERNGWRRKGGPIKNLELVQELYALARARPRATLRWIKAHDGSRWNEYVDVLATGHLR